MIGKFKCLDNLTRIMGTLREHYVFYIYDSISSRVLPRIRNVSDKRCSEN